MWLSADVRCSQFRGNNKTFTDSEPLSFSRVTVSVEMCSVRLTVRFGLRFRQTEVSFESRAEGYPGFGLGSGSGYCWLYQNLQPEVLQRL